MDEMMHYIFGSLQDTEVAMKSVAKYMRKQKRLNWTTALFEMAVTLCITAQRMDIQKLHNELSELKSEVRELKKAEGD